MNTNGQQSDTRWLLDQSRRRSDGKIGHETESLQDKTDSALESLLRNASEIRRLCALHCGRARAVEMPTQTGVISENQSRRLKSRIAIFTRFGRERFAVSWTP